MLIAEIIGNLGHDAVVKQINGKEYTSFDVAHSERMSNGERRTVWVSVLRSGNGGQLLQYLKKGARVFVRGELSAKVYTTRDGATNVSLSVMAREVQICQTVEDGQQQQQHTAQPYRQAAPVQQQQYAPQPAAVTAQPAAQTLEDDGEDLPF